MISRLESPLIRAFDDARDDRDIIYINKLVSEYNAAESNAVLLLAQMIGKSAFSSEKSDVAREIYRREKHPIGILVISLLANGKRQAEFTSNR